MESADSAEGCEDIECPLRNGVENTASEGFINKDRPYRKNYCECLKAHGVHYSVEYDNYYCNHCNYGFGTEYYLVAKRCEKLQSSLTTSEERASIYIDALDHINRVARNAREQSKRDRWIEARAAWALDCKEFDMDALPAYPVMKISSLEKKLNKAEQELADIREWVEEGTRACPDNYHNTFPAGYGCAKIELQLMFNGDKALTQDKGVGEGEG